MARNLRCLTARRPRRCPPPASHLDFIAAMARSHPAAPRPRRRAPVSATDAANPCERPHKAKPESPSFLGLFRAPSRRRPSGGPRPPSRVVCGRRRQDRRRVQDVYPRRQRAAGIGKAIRAGTTGAGIARAVHAGCRRAGILGDEPQSVSAPRRDARRRLPRRRRAPRRRAEGPPRARARLRRRVRARVCALRDDVLRQMGRSAFRGGEQPRRRRARVGRAAGARSSAGARRLL